MASNHYHDSTVAPDLTEKELRRMAIRSMFLQASFNYERMQAAGWLFSILPGLRSIHKDEKDFKRSMKEHLEFFNTHPFLVTFIMGIILAMEQRKEDREAIRGIKVATMGPLGGIGDALFWLTLLPITAGIGASMAIEGNIAGPFFFLIVFNIFHFALRFGLMEYSYKMGVKAVAKLKEGTKLISRAASIVGLTVVGGLVATYVSLSINYTWKMGEGELNIQTGVLDQIMPALLPLSFTFLVYWLLKKGRSPLTIILIIVIIGLIGSYFGFL